MMLAFTNIARTQEPELVVTPLTPGSTYVLDKSDLDRQGMAGQTAVIPPSHDHRSSDNYLQPEWGDAAESLLTAINCTPDRPALNQAVDCTITLQNRLEEPLYLNLSNNLPYPLELIPGSVSGAEVHKERRISFRGWLAAGSPAELAIINAPSPAGYISLASLGIPPLLDVADDTLFNFGTPPFRYLGQLYTVLGATSNGIVIPGGGSAADLGQPPQTFPDPTPPNNVIAPFWTDLDPSAGGYMYAASVIGGDRSWVVIEWQDVPAFGGNDAYTFQVWLASDSEEEDISLVYHRLDGAGASSGLSVGAEDATGQLGANFAGLPTPDDSLKPQFSPPGPGPAYTISYQAIARSVGPWSNCALVKLPTVWQMGMFCAEGDTQTP